MKRVAGILTLTLDGRQLSAHGSFTVSFGVGARSSVIGSDGIPIGFKEIVSSPPSIQGELIDTANFSIRELVNTTNAVAVLTLGSGKQLILRGCYYAGGGESQISSTEDGKIALKLEGSSIEELLPGGDA
jgi:hypothetical protein